MFFKKKILFPWNQYTLCNSYLQIISLLGNLSWYIPKWSKFFLLMSLTIFYLYILLRICILFYMNPRLWHMIWKMLYKFLSNEMNEWSDANFSQNYFHSQYEGQLVLFSLSWWLNIRKSQVIHKAYDSDYFAFLFFPGTIWE